MKKGCYVVLVEGFHFGTYRAKGEKVFYFPSQVKYKLLQGVFAAKADAAPAPVKAKK